MENRASHFHKTKKSDMNSYFYLAAILLVGFLIYVWVRDMIFEPMEDAPSESFLPVVSTPAPSSIELRQAPLYPAQTTMPSGPQAPSVASEEDVVVHPEPQATDPYQEHQETSDIPETLRHPERSFRPAPHQDQTSLAVESGIASHRTHVPFDGSQKFQTETISGGGEFMPGIFANDTFDDRSFSAF